MSAAWETVSASEVRVGDRVRAGEAELTVTRIDHGLMGMDTFVAFVEDSATQWLKLPSPVDGEVEVQRAS